ncbi:MAG: hypothetical protein KDC05_16565 [Bacteroidales bacterium]|nr:hypothetical protein [Bacteroidales bacterium]
MKKYLVLLFLSILIVGLSSCSGSRKLKKKCKECPEFSEQNNKPVHLADYAFR